MSVHINDAINDELDAEIDDDTETDPDAAIEAAIEQKIRAAVDAAIANGDVNQDSPIAVGVAADGTITVFNADSTEISGQTESGEPDPVEFPAMYREDGRTSETERYGDHLETHWGF